MRIREGHNKRLKQTVSHVNLSTTYTTMGGRTFEKWRSGWKKPMRGDLEKAEKKPKKSGVSSNGNCENKGDNGAPDDSASDGGSEEE